MVFCVCVCVCVLAKANKSILVCFGIVVFIQFAIHRAPIVICLNCALIGKKESLELPV